MFLSTPQLSCDRTNCSNKLLIINLAKLSDWRISITLTIAIYQILSVTKNNVSTLSNLILIFKLDYFTFISAQLLPVLRFNLTLLLRLLGLSTNRWVRPYLGGFPTVFYRLTKALQNFFRSLGEISSHLVFQYNTFYR